MTDHEHEWLVNEFDCEAGWYKIRVCMDCGLRERWMDMAWRKVIYEGPILVQGDMEE